MDADLLLRSRLCCSPSPRRPQAACRKPRAVLPPRSAAVLLERSAQGHLIARCRAGQVPSPSSREVKVLGEAVGVQGDSRPRSWNEDTSLGP